MARDQVLPPCCAGIRDVSHPALLLFTPCFVLGFFYPKLIPLHWPLHYHSSSRIFLDLIHLGLPFWQAFVDEQPAINSDET